jgi:predicted DNA binding CopG/RHH family protein
MIMKKEYDLSKLKSRKNPYVKYLKKQITIRVNNRAIDYFKDLSATTGIPYQNLIDSYLTDCALNNKKLTTKWD